MEKETLKKIHRKKINRYIENHFRYLDKKIERIFLTYAAVFQSTAMLINAYNTNVTNINNENKETILAELNQKNKIVYEYVYERARTNNFYHDDALYIYGRWAETINENSIAVYSRDIYKYDIPWIDFYNYMELGDVTTVSELSENLAISGKTTEEVSKGETSFEELENSDHYIVIGAIKYEIKSLILEEKDYEIKEYFTGTPFNITVSTLIASLFITLTYITYNRFSPSRREEYKKVMGKQLAVLDLYLFEIIEDKSITKAELIKLLSEIGFMKNELENHQISEKEIKKQILDIILNLNKLIKNVDNYENVKKESKSIQKIR